MVKEYINEAGRSSAEAMEPAEAESSGHREGSARSGIEAIGPSSS